MGLWTLLGLTVGLASWALVPGARPGRLRRLVAGRARDAARGRTPPWWALIPVIGAGVIAVVPHTAWVLTATAGVVVGAAVWLLRRGAFERARLRNRAEVVRACGVIAGQLEIGEIPSRALRVGAHDCALIAPAAATVAIGGDPTTELRALGLRPGCAGLIDLADGWRLCERTGMPLAQTVRTITDAVRSEADAEAAREAELSSARATGRLMAVLPLVGLMLGYAVQADPLEFLLHRWVGQLCLLGAAALASVGLVWTQRLSEDRT